MKIQCKIFLKLILILFIGENAFSQQVVLSSPDKKISVSVFIQKDKKLYYKISANGIEVLRSSRLGIAREDEDFSAGMVWLNASAATTVRDNYSILTAKKSKISYTAIRRTIYLRSAGGKKMNIVFQVSDDGVAFRYEFPERSADVKKINSEITSFHFNDGTKA